MSTDHKLMEMLTGWIGAMPVGTSGMIAAACFFGGYLGLRDELFIAVQAEISARRNTGD